MGQLANTPGGNYARQLDAFIAGQILDARYTEKESFVSIDPNEIGFGLGLVWGQGADNITGTRLPRLNSQVLAANTALITGNSTIVTVNGNSTTATVYASSASATMDAIAAKIADLPGVLSVTVDTNSFVIVGDNVDIDSSAETTGGDSQPTWTPAAATSADRVKGISVLKLATGTLPTPQQSSVGIGYLLQESVTVLKKGVIAAVLSDDLDNDEIGDTDVNAYISTANDANRGKITNKSAGNLLVGTFRPDLNQPGFSSVEGGIALVEVAL